MKILPDSIMQYAKGWAALLGAFLTTAAAISPLPTWCTIAGAFFSVFLVVASPKNAEKAADDPRSEGTAADVDEEDKMPADTVQPLVAQPVKRATRKPRAPAKKAPAKKSTS